MTGHPGSPGGVRRAKIVATLGPASADERSIGLLLGAGADVFRLNLSHGSRDEHRETIRRIRRVCESLGRWAAVIVDLMGPRFRLGRFEPPRELREGDRLSLGAEGDDVDLPVSQGNFLEHLRRGERILIDNGMVELEVTHKRGRRVRARVVSGGVVSSRKGINLPDSDLPFEISRKDREDIRLAVEEKADYLAASYVGRARDVEAVRRVVSRIGGELPIVAKLERGRAIDNLDEIVTTADAVMVARGDLGVEVPLHDVPVIQKRIIDAAWRFGRPVIVATQMLESMMDNPRPTRAESSDVANAVFDGADALMLSGETAVGHHPVEAVATMARIIERSETYHREFGEAINAPGAYDLEPPQRPGTFEIPETVSAASVLAARQLGARAIVALSQAGFTARQLACRRPSTPVVAISRSRQTCQRLQLVWGVRGLLFEEEVEHHAEVVSLIDRLLLEAGMARPGQRIVILMGDPILERPPTNLMRLHTIRDEDSSTRPRGTKSRP